MMQHRISLIVILLCSMVGSVGCVGKKKYQEAVADGYALQQENADLERQRNTLQDNLDKAVGKTIDQKRLLDEAYLKLAESSAEAGALKSDMVRMKDDVARLEQAMDEMTQRENQAKASLDAFKELVQKFQGLIDAGTLRVKVVDGLMIVELATDILFSPGKDALSKDGVTAISEVSDVLKMVEGRQVQVAGHTDNVPIKNTKFPTNWHLGAARAIAVTEILIDSGLDSDRVSASSYADTRPADTNRTKEGRSRNRRIELILVPDLSLLPGAEELKNFADGQ